MQSTSNDKKVQFLGKLVSCTTSCAFLKSSNFKAVLLDKHHLTLRKPPERVLKHVIILTIFAHLNLHSEGLTLELFVRILKDGLLAKTVYFK